MSTSTGTAVPVPQPCAMADAWVAGQVAHLSDGTSYLHFTYIASKHGQLTPMSAVVAALFTRILSRTRATMRP